VVFGFEDRFAAKGGLKGGGGGRGDLVTSHE